MLGLRFFECRQCGTVFAGPDTPPYCDSCDGVRVTEITDSLQADTYFSRRQDQQS